MRSLIFVLTVLSVSACAPSQKKVSGSEQEKETSYVSSSAQDETYRKLVSKIKSREADAEDFSKIRDIYPHTEGYNPYGGPSVVLSSVIMKMLKDEQWGKCLDLAETVLSKNYISLTAHFGMYACGTETGNKESSEYHRYVLDGLMQSINDSGDGESFDSAYYTTNTRNLQMFLLLKGVKTIDQSLIEEGGKVYDVMTVEDRETGEKRSVYFDITKQYAIGGKKLDEAVKKEMESSSE